MNAIFFTDATTADGLRKELLADLERRYARAVNAMQAARTQRGRALQAGVQAELYDMIQFYKNLVIGDPRRKIVASRTNSIIDQCSWQAIYDDYDGAPDVSPQPIGFGSTEAEAIAELKEWDTKWAISPA